MHGLAGGMSDRAKYVRGLLESSRRRMIALAVLMVVPLLLAYQVTGQAMSETKSPSTYPEMAIVTSVESVTRVESGGLTSNTGSRTLEHARSRH